MNVSVLHKPIQHLNLIILKHGHILNFELLFFKTPQGDVFLDVSTISIICLLVLLTHLYIQSSNPQILKSSIPQSLRPSPFVFLSETLNVVPCPTVDDLTKIFPL